MRKLLISSILLTLCAFSNAQSDGQVKIVRTDGTTIIGALQSADGAAVSIKIAGVEMTIPMLEVQSIEEYSADTTQQNTEATSGDAKELSDHYADYIITDNNPAYPDSFTVEVDGQQITMVLVRGGMFNMGYDDRNSLSMHSEPVHRVELSSYYVSDDFVVPSITKWEKAKKIVDEIAAEQGAPYRMVTEAEWEYAAILPVQEIIFKKTYLKHRIYKAYGEWCQDFWGDYSAQRQVNPTGPEYGWIHVKRLYVGSWKRKNFWRIQRINGKAYVRIAISADKIPNTINEK